MLHANTHRPNIDMWHWVTGAWRWQCQVDRRHDTDRCGIASQLTHLTKDSWHKGHMTPDDNQLVTPSCHIVLSWTRHGQVWVTQLPVGSHPCAMGMSTDGIGVGRWGVRVRGLSHVTSFLGIYPNIGTRVFSAAAPGPNLLNMLPYKNLVLD